MLLLKGLLGSLAQLSFFAALLLLPAGTWEWPRAIQFLVVYGILLLFSTLALAIYAPASLDARLQRPVDKTQPRDDRIISFLLFIAMTVWFILIPVDVFYLKWFPMPGLLLSVIGAGVFLAGYTIILTAVFQNEFAAPIVKDQHDRGHRLVDTGLYGHIRHPLYSGFLLLMTGLGLWLESYLSVLLIPVIFLILVGRIHIEEKTLRETLPGYIEYMERVRYRICPLLW